MSSFSYEISLSPRYRDLDPNGHVNNAVYATYFEEARTAYWRAVIEEPLADAGVAIVSLAIEYKAEIALDDELTVAMRVDELGESSIPQVYELRASGEVVARGEAVMVAFDRNERQSRPIPDRWRASIEAHEHSSGNDRE